MKTLLLAAALLFLTTPAHAQEDVDRNAQMKLLQQNFMKRQGISGEAVQNQAKKPSQHTKRQNKEYRDAMLKVMNERKLQLQGRR